MPFNVDYSPVGLLSALAQTSGEGDLYRQKQARDLSLIQLSMKSQADARRAIARTQATRLQAAALADRQRVSRSRTPVARHIASQVPGGAKKLSAPATKPFITNAQELSMIQQHFKERRAILAKQLETGLATEDEKTEIQKQIDDLYAKESETISQWRLRGRGVFAAPAPPASGSVSFDPNPSFSDREQRIIQMARGMAGPEAAAKINIPKEIQTTTWGSTASAPVRVSSDADFAALPSGTVFVGPDGLVRRKP